MRKLIAIFLVWLGSAFAWMILGSSLVYRTSDAGDSHGRVSAMWGPPLTQSAPRTWYIQGETQDVPLANAQGTERRLVQVNHNVPLAASQVDVELNLAHRQRGLRWFTTYDVAFEGTYRIGHDNGVRPTTFEFELPRAQAGGSYRSESYGGEALASSIDNLFVRDEQGRALHYEANANHITVALNQDGVTSTNSVSIHYRTRGTESFRYDPGSSLPHENLNVVVHTNHANIDFTDDSLSPTQQARSGNGWQGTWRFSSLLSTRGIGVRLPDKIQPGDAAARITFFAPVGLLFFFFVIAMLAHLQKRALHPMHYFYFSTAFFAFHLLFAYTADRLPLYGAFALAAGVSVFLLVSYARLFAGWMFALREIGIAQLIYLVAFSGTFFLPGATGLSITVIAIVTLFVMMQSTGRVDWFAASSKQEPAGPARDE